MTFKIGDKVRVVSDYDLNRAFFSKGDIGLVNVVDDFLYMVNFNDQGNPKVKDAGFWWAAEKDLELVND